MKTVAELNDNWILATEMHKLQARLWRLAQRDAIQVLMFTSAVRGEGKSTTVAYLATALAQYPERRVLAVDFDLRTPMLHNELSVGVSCGIDSVLVGAQPVEAALLESNLRGLQLLSAKPEGADPQVLLRTRELYDLFQWARRHYDLVLVDTPALMPVADASLLIPQADGVVLTAMANSTTKGELNKAREQCLSMGARIVGLVVTNMQEAFLDYRKESQHYYRSQANGK